MMPYPAGLRWWLSFELAVCFTSVAAYHQLSCPTAPNHVIHSLDSHQASTVASSAPAVLITAGPGTGKTHVLAARLKRIIEPERQQSREDDHGEEKQNKYWVGTTPESILVLSFSKGGAKQVVDRAIDMGLSRKLACRVTSTTFHGMSASMLRRHCKPATGMSCFALASYQDQDSAVSLALMKAGLSNYLNPEKKHYVLRQISLWKDLGLGIEDISDITAETNVELTAKAVYALYNANLRMKGLLDHGDLPMLALRLLQKEPNILSRYRLHLQHVLVDEFQDVGAVQYALLRLLVVGGKGLTTGRQLGSSKPNQGFIHANKKRKPIVADEQGQPQEGGGGGLLRTLQPQSREVWVDDALHHDPNAPIGVQVKLFCAADEDQRIYAWRGAAASHLHRFCVDFPGSERHSWAMTHRLPLHILSSAGELLQVNHRDTGRRHSDMNHTVKTKNKILGARISVKGLWSSREEGKWIARQIRDIHDGRVGGAVPYGRIAVLVRCWSQAAALEECLVAQQIPYSCGGGAGKGNNFFARDELMRPLALLRLCLNPYSNSAFDVVLSGSSISRVGCDIVHQMSRLHDLSLLEAANRLVGTGRLNPEAEQQLSRLVGGIQVWTGWIRSMEGQGTSTHVRSEYDSRLCTYWRIFYEAGYLPAPSPVHLAESGGEKEDNIPDRFQSVKDLSVAVAGYDSLAQFLLHTELDPIGADGRFSTDDALQLLSMHQAKGKEYDVVFLPGWEEGIFPLMPTVPFNKGQVEGDSSSCGDAGDGRYTSDKKDPNMATATAVCARLEEERRLAYVALTRARRNVVISYTRRRRMNGQWLQVMGPSRFLSELPTRHLSVTQPNGGIHTTLEARVGLHWDMTKKDRAKATTENGCGLPDLALMGEDLIQSSPSLRPLEGLIDLADLLTTKTTRQCYNNDEPELNTDDSLPGGMSRNGLSEKRVDSSRRTRTTTAAATAAFPHKKTSKSPQPSSWKQEEIMLNDTREELGEAGTHHKIQMIDRNEMSGGRRRLLEEARDNKRSSICTLSSRKRGRPRKGLLPVADMWNMVLKLEDGKRTVKEGVNYAAGFGVNAIKRIQEDQSIAQASLKAFFREVLSVQFGIHRGSIPKDKHHGKERISISRASSKQLGTHLISMLQLQKECQEKKLN